MTADWDAVLAEVQRATIKYPTWPTDPLHAIAVLGEEFGELTKAVLQHTYEPHKASMGDVRDEAVQTAAMALRFVASLDSYEFRRSSQHEQPPAALRERESAKEVERLRGALRGVAIIAWGDGESTCEVCENVWMTADPEAHKPCCLAAEKGEQT